MTSRGKAAQPPIPRKKRFNVTRVACNTCRVKKTACDGGRPICKKCLESKTACIYDTENTEDTRSRALRKENERLKQRVAELEASARRDSRQTIASSSSGSSLSMSPNGRRHALASDPITTFLSPHSLARSMLPSSRSWLEYELITQYPDCYNLLRQLDATQIQSNFAMVNPLYAALGRDPYPTGFIDGNATPFDPMSQSYDGSDEITPSSQAPLSISGAELPPVYCDPRLAQLQIGAWTNVQLSNRLAAEMLSWYLEADHPSFGFFDAGLFVQDLIGERAVHCSRLLVNVLLLWISHALDASDDGVESLRSALSAETMLEWAKASMDDSTSIPDGAAALLLSNHFSCIGQDEEGRKIIRAAYYVGVRLDLYGPPLDIPHGVSQFEIEALRSNAHFAWGMFNYITFLAFHYHDLIFDIAPRYPMPGSGGILAYDESYRAWYHPLPIYMGNTFTRACHFFLIGNEIVLNYHQKHLGPVLGRVPLSFAESILRKLLDWAKENVVARQPGGGYESVHWKIQNIHFHTIVIDLFTPFQQTGETLTTFGYAKSTPQDIIWASGQQLRYHILTLPLQHPRLCVMWHNALLHVLNASINDLAHPESWFFFLVCLRNYQTLSARYPIMGPLVKAYLNIAMERSAISIATAKALWQQLTSTAASTILTAVKASYVVDLDGALVDEGQAQAEAQIEAFDKNMAIVEQTEMAENDMAMGLNVNGDGEVG
ncbi:hypothetical protein PRZ48_006914 [Zasmidium cellare]|uniref:Zn(2)-C6 fungal-type domain-containing protein n=1 Tax=Zasmidium cellare TaxID=395010 RepID=A0ABR0EIT4_ZASCE|nr:hypothetical protein PRZ48_006914 [Zasmidium cellare]